MKEKVVLIVVDTLSTLHLPTHGYDRDTAPFLSKLARENTSFQYAYSDSPWTVPSHASIFSGKTSDQHITGTRNLYFTASSFVEKLQEEDHKTVGFSHNPLVSTELGFDKGFDYFKADRDKILMTEKGYENLYKTVESTDTDKEGVEKHLHYFKKMASEGNLKGVYEGLRYLSDKFRDDTDIGDQMIKSTTEQVKNEEKFFAFLNLNQVHSPYDPNVTSPWTENEEIKDWPKDVSCGQENFWYKEISEEKLEQLRKLYDTCIREADQKIEKLYKQITEEHPETTFIITADHGENLGDYEMRGHQCGIFEKLVRVPLIIAGENIQNRKITEQASISNIGNYIKSEDVEELKQEEIRGKYEGNIHLKEDKETETEQDKTYLENTSEMEVKQKKIKIEHSGLKDKNLESESSYNSGKRLR